MGREIKFRVWDEIAKYFLPSENNDGLNFGVKESIIGFSLDLSKLIKNSNNENNKETPWTVQQFTGLLDKNGKEIYEGDIIHFECGNQTILVNFEDGCFNFGGNAASQSDANFYKIIGNIYENPDLIK